MFNNISKILPPLLLLIVLVIFLESVVRLGWVQAFLLPPPSQILSSFFELQDDFITAFFSTSLSAIVGLICSVMVGFTTALILTQFPILEKALYPYTILFQTVPIVAIAPLLVVWFGFGPTTVRISAFIVSVFPVLANAMTGLKQTSPELLELFRSMKASTWQTLWKLRVPFAVPYILAGIEIASGLAVIGTVIGEFVAGSGLGSLIDSARAQQRVDIMFAAVLLASLFGVLLIGCTRLLKRLLQRYSLGASA